MTHNFKDEPDIKLSEKYGKYFDLVNSFLSIYSKLEISIHEKKLQKNALGEYDYVLLTSAPKMIGSVLAITKLCDWGLVEDANSLLRKLIELSASLLYINKEVNLKTRRVKWFVNFQAIKNKKKLNRAIQKPQEFGVDISKELIAMEKKIMADYEKAKNVYPLDEKRDIAPAFQSNWAGIPFDQILLECGMKKELSTYVVLSESIHFSSLDIEKYIDFENSVIRTGVDDKQVPFILIKTLQLAGQVIEFCDQNFKLNLASDMNALFKEIQLRNSKLINETGTSAF